MRRFILLSALTVIALAVPAQAVSKHGGGGRPGGGSPMVQRPIAAHSPPIALREQHSVAHTHRLTADGRSPLVRHTPTGGFSLTGPNPIQVVRQRTQRLVWRSGRWCTGTIVIPASTRCGVTTCCNTGTCTSSVPLSVRCCPTLPSGDACPPAGGSDIDDSTPPATEYGLAISRVLDGSAAAKAGLRAGDILLSIGADRVQSFDEMVAALAKAAGNVDVIFVNGESGQTERMPVTPAGGKLGVAVEPVPLD